MKKKILWMLFAVALCINISSCSKDDDDDKSSSGSGSASSTYCWDFLYQGSVLTSQCGLTENEADEVVREMKNQGFTITKRRK